MGQELRPYQQQARERIHAEWENGHTRTLLVLPTGTGKTNEGDLGVGGY